MEALLYQDIDSFPRTLEPPTYIAFYARRGILLMPVDYPGRDSPFHSLSNKKCDHYPRGCPGECESNETLCDACKENKCDSIHN
ncbi:hypothetical protein F4821DRAFT_221223 [Hypoxylon rubiginosum]|uniref:Uncharacterized protein n=1 Tax=Hypoxylon rubiginosum TaxID=110542 RepID=A0ACC0DLM2_9PEZI|nr:hypothetical protein F4821DRAFT_221223 [Hypoxylon rubiginosum]